MIAYIVRHTSVLNEQNLCYGQSNMPLADSFAQQAKAIAGILPQTIDRCYSSPLARCTQLAEYLYDKPIVKDNALMELNFGDWEMRPWDSINRDDIEHWSADFVNNPCPGGESFAQLNDRVLNFWKKLLADHGKETVLVVTHGGVIRSLTAHVQGTSLYDTFSQNIKPGYVMRIDTARHSYVVTEPDIVSFN